MGEHISKKSSWKLGVWLESFISWLQLFYYRWTNTQAGYRSRVGTAEAGETKASVLPLPHFLNQEGQPLETAAAAFTCIKRSEETAAFTDLGS